MNVFLKIDFYVESSQKEFFFYNLFTNVLYIPFF